MVRMTVVKGKSIYHEGINYKAGESLVVSEEIAARWGASDVTKTPAAPAAPGGGFTVKADPKKAEAKPAAHKVEPKKDADEQ